jgi:hypothetical protein
MHTDSDSIEHQRQLLQRAEGLSPGWCIVHHLPKMQSAVVAWYTSRTDAETCIQFMKRIRPLDSYIVMFDFIPH